MARPTPFRGRLHAMRTVSLALALAASAAAQRTNDVVYTKAGAVLRGLEVTVFESTTVRGKQGTAPFSMPAAEVADVEWGDAPPAFAQARLLLQRGEFRSAVQLFGDVQTLRPQVRADALHFQVEAAVAAIGDDKNAAATAARHAHAFVNTHPTHFRTPRVRLLAGRAERLAGNHAAATRTLRALDERGDDNGLRPQLHVEARFELGLCQRDAGDHSTARATFQATTQLATAALAERTAHHEAPALRSLHLLAQSAAAETFLSVSDWTAAEAAFQALTAAADPASRAAGHAGLGETICRRGLAEPRLADLRRCQLELALAAMLDPTGGDPSAKANYWLGRCLLALGAEREGVNFRTRAHTYFQIVLDHYPGSRWAEPAATAITR